MKREKIRARLERELLLKVPDSVDGEKHLYTWLKNGKRAECRIHTFYAYDILEMSIMDDVTEDVLFWLHFEVRQKEDTELFMATFFDYLNRELADEEACLPVSETRQNVLLCCTGGLTTNLFAELMNETIEAEGLPLSVRAVGVDKVAEIAADYDRVLLAPQVCYRYTALKKQFGAKIHRLSTMDFATLNVLQVIRDVLISA